MQEAQFGFLGLLAVASRNFEHETSLSLCLLVTYLMVLHLNYSIESSVCQIGLSLTLKVNYALIIAYYEAVVNFTNSLDDRPTNW